VGGLRVIFINSTQGEGKNSDAQSEYLILLLFRGGSVGGGGSGDSGGGGGGDDDDWHFILLKCRIKSGGIIMAPTREHICKYTNTRHSTII